MNLTLSAVIILPILFSGLTFIALLKIIGKERLSYPLDIGLKYNNKRIFGKNKTIKGPIIMAVFTGIYGWLLANVFRVEVFLGLSNLTIFYYYAIVGLFYSLGELPNSFIKRQLSIPPGGISKKIVEAHFFKVLDIFDSLFACGVVYYLLLNFSMNVILISILIGGFLHLMTDQLMIYLKIKTRNK